MIRTKTITDRPTSIKTKYSAMKKIAYIMLLALLAGLPAASAQTTDTNAPTPPPADTTAVTNSDATAVTNADTAAVTNSDATAVTNTAPTTATVTNTVSTDGTNAP